MKTFIIGCGGVGSWLTPLMCKLQPPDSITVVDGDKIEERNLDRQLFSPDSIGVNKAEALSSKYGTVPMSAWFSLGILELYPGDILMVCVDNHPARNAALQEAVMSGVSVIIGANETYSAEAFYFAGRWAGSKLDPRVYYPEIATNHDNDPRAAQIGCTGEAQASNPQLASANFIAAALMVSLYTAWAVESYRLDSTVLSRLPYHLISNLTKLESRRVCDVTK